MVKNYQNSFPKHKLRKMSRIVWFCEFRGDINSWDLKILYKDLGSWEKELKKNGMECNGL